MKKIVKNVGYSENIQVFLNKPVEEIESQILQRDTSSELRIQQRDSWREEIEILKENFKNLEYLEGKIIFEYSIPRLKGRIDVVLIIGKIIFTIEFKVNAEEYLLPYKQQANGYAIDLKNAHKESQNSVIVPILICTKAKKLEKFQFSKNIENIYNLIEDNGDNLDDIIKIILNKEPTFSKQAMNEDWENSRYYPTPSIIEQAVNVFSNHTVENITKTEAQEKLQITSDCVNSIIEKTKKEGKKAIIFVTGVPGAGKTLIGLNVVNERQQSLDKAVFLSGNGPLVAVLREALAKDMNTNKDVKKGEAKNKVKYMIQMIHQYRDEFFKIVRFNKEGNIEIDDNLRNKNKEDGYAEVEHVVIFDEAQRAWDQDTLNDFYHEKYDKQQCMPYSEPGFLIWSMNLREDWAVIVCLVGQGQEIFKGESGIAEWILQARKHFPDWELYMSDKIELQSNKDYHDQLGLEKILNNKHENNIIINPDLHLSISQRSLRSGRVAEFIEAILACNTDRAKKLYEEIKTKYPIFITRNISKAKEWCWENILNNNGKVEDRCGVLASSRAGRIKALGYEMKNFKTLGDNKIAAWFLNDSNDPRSSIRMEEALSEFLVQGLEIDYATVIWDADYRYNKEKNEWDKFYTSGMSWKRNNEKVNKTYHDNAYRVLLTRSRKGMIIVVPEGDKRTDTLQDSTRFPEFYDSTYNYLHEEIGIIDLP